MAYCSDVCLVLSKKGVQALNAELASQPEDARKEVEKLLRRADHYLDKDSGDEFRHWRSIRWYYDLPNVSFINRFLDDLENDGVDDADYDDFYFIRCGDSDDDIEIMGSHFDNSFGLYLVKYADFDVSKAEVVKKCHCVQKY